MTAIPQLLQKVTRKISLTFRSTVLASELLSYKRIKLKETSG